MTSSGWLRPGEAVDDCAHGTGTTHRDVAVQAERRRVLGVLLAAIGRHRLAGRRDIADALDDLAIVIEHPERER